MKKTLRMNVFEKTYISPTCTITNLDFEGTYVLCTSQGTGNAGHDGYTSSDYEGGWD